MHRCLIIRLPHNLPIHRVFFCFFRIAAAGADFGLYLLTKSSAEEENIFPFGRGLSGHHGKIHEMAYCGGQSEDSSRYLATVSGGQIHRDAVNCRR